MEFHKITAGMYEAKFGAYRYDIEKVGCAWLLSVVYVTADGYGIPQARFDLDSLASAKGVARSYASRA